MGDFEFPVALRWDQGPERLKQVKNKLLTYFQSKRKSDGGECVIKKLDCSGGHILIHFNQETVRERVLQRRIHELELPDGEKLMLEVRRPDADASKTNAVHTGVQDLPADRKATGSQQDPVSAAAEGSPREADEERQEPASSLVLVENLPPSHTEQVLGLLLENVSNKEADRDFHVEMIPEISSAAVTFICDIDIADFIQKFAECKRAIQYKLSAKVLEETRSIRVEHLPPETTEDLLMNYFESSKHGGGKVEEVVLLPEEGAACVTFLDKRVARRVLSGRHVLGKTPLSVYPYIQTLAIALYGKNGPRVTEPLPLEFPVSPYILEFILKDPQRKHNVEEKMKTQYCEITWPDLSHSNPDIKLCIPRDIATRLRTLAKIAPTWEDRASNVFSMEMSKFRVTEHDVKASVWGAIKEKAIGSAYSGVLIKPNLDNEKVFVAGYSQDVIKTDAPFKNLLENTIKKMNRENQSVTTAERLAPALYEIISRSDLLANVESVTTDLKMNYDPSTKTLQLCGQKEDVRYAKNEILNLKQLLKSKRIPVDPHVAQFLLCADSEEMSCVLFTRHNINAMYELDDDRVKLSGYSTEDLSKAEKKIQQGLVSKKVTVDDKSVIQKPEWSRLQESLNNSFNAETCKFRMEQFPAGAENQVVISGLSAEVLETYGQIHDFVEKNTVSEKAIEVQNVAVVHFIKDEKKRLCREVEEMNVKMTTNQRTITLTGPRSSVVKAAAQIQSALSSLSTDTLRINKPGAKKFCESNEGELVSKAKNDFKCLIYLQKDGGKELWESNANTWDPHCQVTLADGVTIAVYKGDLSGHHVDAVVNAANEDLKHIGGLALALLRASGPKLQADSDRIVRENGHLSAGDAVVTEAGNLPCKQVIHAVGPRWNSSAALKCERLLRKAIGRSLELATDGGHASIAIPAVSAGIFGFPLKQCVENIIESVREYLEDHRHGTRLKRIHLVDPTEPVIQAFAEALKKQFGDQNSEKTVKNKEKKEASKSGKQIKKTLNQLTTKEGLTISLTRGNIEDVAADVIVNSVGKDLYLNSGGASKALFVKAGQKLQENLHQASQGVPVKKGCVFVTDGWGLSCKAVFHAVVPRWDGPTSSSGKVLGQIVHTCLDTAEKNQMKSISFPAIGTGVLGFPKDKAAAFMFDEILSFSSKNKAQCLQRVDFVLHPSDTDSFTAFSSELAQRMDIRPSRKLNQGDSAAPSGAVASPALGVHEMNIGPVAFQVKTGDITKEDADIIVNSSNDTFTLRSGVSKAILEAAGQSVYDECVTLGSQPHKRFILTKGGRLRCQNILHVCLGLFSNDIKECVVEALEACEKQQVASVAFPAIGTGVGNLSSSAVAAAMLDAVRHFANSKSPPSIQKVKVVIFQKQMMDDFYAVMTKDEGNGAPKPSVFTRFTNFLTSLFPSNEPSSKTNVFELKEDLEPAIFHLCGESLPTVRKATSWLEDLILKEQDENVITDECIEDFGDQECQRLCELQKERNVAICFQKSKISVSGLSRDVLHSSKEIQALINDIRVTQTRRKEAELCSSLVEWKYQDSSGFTPFDIMTNMELEKASLENRQSFPIRIAGNNYTVNMELKVASDSQGGQVRLQRVSKIGQYLELPSHWDPMNDDQVKTVQLSPASAEFADIQKEFAKTCNMNIIKIERIQNRGLWLGYQTKKQSIDTKNGTGNNEKRLFHGTDPGKVATINHNGFNRSYAGMNAAAFGNGTYFAVQAIYSAHDTYSKPDGNSQKYMYLARVITGIYCAGRGGMLAPPPKNAANPTDLHDSVTDNLSQPSMYVIFNDIQAYPEYLITFRK
ncbi:protein mono-ADP-ribosyltransferase PARP14 [Spea bombifrons]|uniref:protein mono-ADP-ribosyltransferase PARP14 n=1 Tax=Spea bombifrons TaxID=233779 RepID=UPI0023499A2C|nr:protein mono-ADP-ribosyltransferase PARP14 [Spea bombifrons]